MSTGTSHATLTLSVFSASSVNRPESKSGTATGTVSGSLGTGGITPNFAALRPTINSGR